MNAKKFFYILSAIILMAAMLSMVIVTPASAQTPDPWAPFCEDRGALVIQETGSTGDGVAMSIQSAVLDWACGDSSKLVAYVEPWDGDGNRNKSNFPDKFNTETMCVGTVAEVEQFVEESGLGNGSLWINAEKYNGHPLVVRCSAVTNANNLGLNPMENQVDLDRLGWLRGRVEEMFGVQQYVDEYPNDLLAQRIVTLGWASVSGSVVEESAAASAADAAAEESVAPAEESAASEKCIKNTRDGDFLCAPDGTWLFAPAATVKEPTSPNVPKLSGWSIWWATHPFFYTGWWWTLIALAFAALFFFGGNLLRLIPVIGPWLDGAGNVIGWIIVAGTVIVHILIWLL